MSEDVAFRLSFATGHLETLSKVFSSPILTQAWNIADARKGWKNVNASHFLLLW